MSEEQILNATLILIENIMHSKNSTLEKTMPKPIDNSYSLLDNQLLQNELNYSHYDLRERHDEWFGQMTDEQRSVYDDIIGCVTSKTGRVFFCLWFRRNKKNVFVEHPFSCCSIKG